MAPRRLTEKERAEWLGFAQTIGAKPLHPAEAMALAAFAVPAELPAPPPAAVIEAAGKAPPRVARRPPAGAQAAAEIAVGAPTPGLDRASWDRLRRGRLRPERQLDLHGRTAQAAFAAFEQFIASARSEGIRCVEIVTGRGAGEGGVLRRELPHWLNLPQIRGGILAAVHPHRANTGAVLLLLRRRT